MEEAIITAIFTAISGQYLLLLRINNTLTKIKAEFRACPRHRSIFDLNDCDAYEGKN